MFTKPGLRKEKDKPNIHKWRLSGLSEPGELGEQTGSKCKWDHAQTAHSALLGTPPVTHIPPTVRASSTQYRAQITDPTNLGQDWSGSSMLRDKSITIHLVTISQVPGLGPYWPLQAAVAGSARPIFGQEYLSPNIGNLSMMSLKSPKQSRGSECWKCVQVLMQLTTNVVVVV